MLQAQHKLDESEEVEGGENDNGGHKGGGSSIGIVIFMANLPVNINLKIPRLIIYYLLFNLHSNHLQALLYTCTIYSSSS